MHAFRIASLPLAALRPAEQLSHEHHIVVVLRLGSTARRSRVRLGLLRLLILLLGSVRRLGRLHLGGRLLLRWLAIDCY